MFGKDQSLFKFLLHFKFYSDLALLCLNISRLGFPPALFPNVFYVDQIYRFLKIHTFVENIYEAGYFLIKK